MGFIDNTLSYIRILQPHSFLPDTQSEGFHGSCKIPIREEAKELGSMPYGLPWLLIRITEKGTLHLRILG